jgi:hypothetical protein
MLSKHSRWIGLLLCFCLGLIGCAKSESNQTTEDAHIKQLAVYYGLYLSKHKGKPPANEEVFKNYVAEALKSRQSQDSVDKVFTSPRDNQAYVVRFEKSSNASKPVVFVYEKAGKDGKRFVAFSQGATELVDDTRFKELVPSS